MEERVRKTRKRKEERDTFRNLISSLCARVNKRIKGFK
jgi:hypothetical protein